MNGFEVWSHLFFCTRLIEEFTLDGYDAHGIYDANGKPK
jgi:hypothetical protein